MDISCFTEVYNYWKQNPQFWIAIQNQKQADKDIYHKWFEILNPFSKQEYISNIDNFSKECLIGYIIYLDQFQRHFDRYLNIQNNINLLINRIHCIELLKKQTKQFWLNLSEDELYFCLMPYKHQYKYEFCISMCYRWLQNKSNRLVIKDFKIISKFYNDTYRKNIEYIDYANVKNNIQTSENRNIYNYDSELICEYFPNEFYENNWTELFNIKFIKQELINKLLCLKSKYNHIYVSLSGGVDSMVILYLAKLLKLNVSVIHIIYGNRKVSEQEFEFIQHYCNILNVKLYYYRIINLKRSEIEREFYESITRDIRFAVYKYFIDEFPNSCIILGHILDDIVENIWTNFAKCQHLGNLKKMEFEEQQMGVQLVRPFLDVNKSDILEISRQFCIPYLNNTTPSWSNRGKFREYFYKSTHQQYGSSVDSNIIKVAEILRHQSNIIEKLIYKPILDSFNEVDKSIDITRAFEANMDIGEWQYLLEKYCHEKLHIAKPSIHSIKQFVERLKKNNFEKYPIIKFQMKQSYQFIISKNNNNNQYLLYLHKLSVNV